MKVTLKDQGWRFVLREDEFRWVHPSDLRETDHDCTNMNDVEFFNFVIGEGGKMRSPFGAFS